MLYYTAGYVDKFTKNGLQSIRYNNIIHFIWMSTFIENSFKPKHCFIYRRSFTNGQQFSTYDADHETSSIANCAQLYNGAWWYTTCGFSCLNGIYNNTGYAQGVMWSSWNGLAYSHKFSEMKFRPNP